MKRELVFYSVVSCILITFYVVYNGCVRDILSIGDHLYYGNISETLYCCGFSAFFFAHGYRVKDYGLKRNSLYIASIILAFAMVSGVFLASDESWVDFTGISDGTWAVWFIPVLAVYLLTGIPASSRVVNMNWRYKALIPIAMVVLYVMCRLMYFGKLDYQVYHLGKVLFFLPLFYLGYLYRTKLENMDFFKDYLRMTSWTGASFLAIISIIFLKYYDFSFLRFHLVADALIQLTCMGLAISTFASLKNRCKEFKEIENGEVIMHSSIPVVVMVVLFYEMLLQQNILVKEMEAHDVVMPLAMGVLLVAASYSVVLIAVVFYKMVKGGDYMP